MISEMVLEYRNLFPNKNKWLVARAFLCYKRMIKFRVIVLIRMYLNTDNVLRKRKLANKLLLKYGLEIGSDCQIGNNLKVEHCNGVVIGNKVIIGNNCTIYQQVTLGQKNNCYPVIGDNVILYPGCKVIGGISIGRNSIIGTNAVVLHDVPDNCVVAGIPAKIVSYRNIIRKE